MRHLFYLHGFTSSPLSSKAQFLSKQLAAYHLTLHCPDLNQPDFSTLTTTRMIRQTADRIRRLPPAPVVLIGSSLGAFVAWHLTAGWDSVSASTHPVEKLVLLAPALDFGVNRIQELGKDELKSWRESGWRDVMHHAYGRILRVHYELYADASQYDSFETSVPSQVLIVQGHRDDIVDPAMVVRFAAGRPHVRLVMVDDGHQLKESFDRFWLEIEVFLGLNATTI